MKFYWADCFTHLAPILVKGLGVVLEITIISFILFMLIASLLAIGQVAGPKPLRKIIGVFSEIIRGTPALVQVVYIYYVIPTLYAYIRSLFTGKFAYPDMSPIAAGIAGLSICYGAYVGEVIRSAIVNIDFGQTEAGLALGFTKTQVLFKIVFPQAMKNSVPVFGNYLLMLVKDTSILQAISVPELLLKTREYASKSFYTIESYTLVALFYLLLSLPLSRLVKYLERKTKIARTN